MFISTTIAGQPSTRLAERENILWLKWATNDNAGANLWQAYPFWSSTTLVSLGLLFLCAASRPNTVTGSA